MSTRWPPTLGVVGFDGGHRPAISLALQPTEPVVAPFEEEAGGTTGACCSGTWPDLICSEVTEAECDDLGGNYLGDGTTCDDVNCNLGACCEFDGGCHQTEDFGCDVSTVYWNGYGTDCYTTRCEGPCATCKFCQGPFADCEFMGTPFKCGHTCYENLTWPECEAKFPQEGNVAWIGNWNAGFETCTTFDACTVWSGCCAYPGEDDGMGGVDYFGMCCDGDCNCSENVFEEDCPGLGGTCWEVGCFCTGFSGGLGCGICGFDCGPGACCDADHLGGCTDTDYTTCIGLGGYWGGDASSCAGSAAFCYPVFFGACCYDDPMVHPCEEVFQTVCEARGGTFQGDGTDCDPDPC